MAIVDSNKPRLLSVDIGHALGNSEAKVFKEFDLIPLGTTHGAPCIQVDLVIEKFTCRCPITNQPDYATITINYDPRDYYIETKSLKLYFESFRNRGIFHEHLASQVVSDLSMALKPRYLLVKVKFDSRGGIAVNASAHSGGED